MAPAAIFWFTGLSGAGKTTLAEAVRDRLTAEGRRVLILDGDQVRAAFHRRLGFTPEDIRENNRLIAELCVRYRGACNAILVPIISPFRESRAAARARLSPGFFEIHVSADLGTVTTPDVKGLYARAQRGEGGPMIGQPGAVPYEPPAAPDLTLDTGRATHAESLDRLAGLIAIHLPARAMPVWSARAPVIVPLSGRAISSYDERKGSDRPEDKCLRAGGQPAGQPRTAGANADDPPASRRIQRRLRLTFIPGT